jgi:Potential Queuosine, Q, salvage protein family
MRRDPLGIRAATAWVVERARDVRVVAERAADVAARLAAGELGLPEWRRPPHWWDDADADATAHYVLLLDALNFSFWGEPRWRVAWGAERLDGYWALAAALTSAVEQGQPLGDPDYLARTARAAQLLAGLDGVPIPLLRLRQAALREVGLGLLRGCGGRFLDCVERAGRSAPALVELVAARFPSFRDVAEYDGRPVPFYKRAQLLVADLHGAFAGRGPGAFDDLATLTMFADYKVPQVLHDLGVLAYSPALEAALRARELLPYGDRREVEIRAASVQAVELIVDVLEGRGRHVPAFEVDERLWALGQARPLALPYHRTRSVYY